ncbi:uncharacterized protein VTP21DRAFT_6459 [Calcarisporiella thermophila]|uniref:uncharacterized protein n=1 Tax=Calcarisporiella thermophila TaxID=911321 RepID=UPI003743996E
MMCFQSLGVGNTNMQTKLWLRQGSVEMNVGKALPPRKKALTSVVTCTHAERSYPAVIDVGELVKTEVIVATTRVDPHITQVIVFIALPLLCRNGGEHPHE